MFSKKISMLAAIVFVFSITNLQAQNSINWDDKQLMEPSVLAKIITANTSLPIIISVGPGAIIPNSLNAGMSSNEEGITKLRTILKSKNQNEKIIIYCGCCPFEHCPNVRPAIEILKEMKFTNYYLLNLSHNIKMDWIDKGYPTKK